MHIDNLSLSAYATTFCQFGINFGIFWGRRQLTFAIKSSMLAPDAN